MTLGEILFMEMEAHYREQIAWACSAQSSKMLPKRPSSPQKNKEQAAQQIKSMVSPVFEKYYAEHGKPVRNKNGS